MHLRDDLVGDTHDLKKKNHVRLRYKLTVSVNTELNQGLATSIYSHEGDAIRRRRTVA